MSAPPILKPKGSPLPAIIATIAAVFFSAAGIFAYIHRDDPSPPSREEQTNAFIAKYLAQSKICIAMNPAQVEQVWGKPKRKTESVSAGVTREQWVYEDTTFVYFENGRVTGWQQPK